MRHPTHLPEHTKGTTMTTSQAIGMASRRGSRDHNADAAYVHHGANGTTAAVIDGTGNSAELAHLTDFLAQLAARTGSRHGGMAGLIAAGDLLADDEHEAAAVLATMPADGDGPAVVSWIGDCRAYHWNGDDLRQYTTDHTMGHQLRASGGTPAEIAATHDHWLLIGLSAATAATVRQVWIPDHDQDLTGGLVLLTTDGVHDAVAHADLVALLRTHTCPQQLANAIVSACPDDNATGYRDDATVVVLPGRCVI
ncbi:hypothetical protein E1091_02000 [Micromonospora fluostatini]|uniref:PPM-type phosphatase domain-containing protein n=1 Tax=Micromonospora fluostatini TaxID=1629071 RepID=A0ABY2DPC5_9ACTN|nr:hypothetical protein E1091_02000 [Micromonospora fluostatini]